MIFLPDMPGFTIRPVQPIDYPAVLGVYSQCEDFLALGPQPKASLEMVMADLEISRREGGQFCGIFDSAEEMIGVVDYVSDRFEGQPGLAFLELLMIAAPFRSQGTGAAVVAQVENQIRQQGVAVIQLGVQVNNPRALRFWQQHGYAIISQLELQADGTTGMKMEKKFTTNFRD